MMPLHHRLNIPSYLSTMSKSTSPRPQGVAEEGALIGSSRSPVKPKMYGLAILLKPLSGQHESLAAAHPLD
jgi:hypothetical protein